MHHGIKSSYAHFRGWVKRNDTEVFQAVTDKEIFTVEENWSDFEDSLATLNSEVVRERCSDYLVSYASDAWSEDYHFMYQEALKEITGIYSVRLKEVFIEWLHTLDIDATFDHEKKLNIDIKAKFLSFNYTDILNKFYGVPGINILHIHGKKEYPDDAIMLGHGCNYESGTNQKIDPESYDHRIDAGEKVIWEYFKSTYKPAKQILKNNIKFFSNLGKVLNIVVLGHSLSSIDRVYYEEIVRCIDLTKVNWFVSYYKKTDKTKFTKFFSNLGVDSCRIHLKPISDFKFKYL